MEWFEMLVESRSALGVPQRELAARAHVSLPSVKSYEQGRRHPSRPYLIALLDALGVDRLTRTSILTAAGFSSDGRVQDTDYPTGMFSAEEAVAEIHRCRWPAFVVDEYMGVMDANLAAQRLWDVDLAREYQDPVDRNLLSVASTPRFADRCVNWNDALTRLLGVYKGKPRAPQELEAPSPYFAAILERFLAGDPAYVARLLDLWNVAAPIWGQKMRWSYSIVWRDPDVGLLTFDCVSSIAHHGDGTAFNDWIPADASTWEGVERLKHR